MDVVGRHFSMGLFHFGMPSKQNKLFCSRIFPGCMKRLYLFGCYNKILSGLKYRNYCLIVRLKSRCQQGHKPVTAGENMFLASSNFWWLLALFALRTLDSSLCLYEYTASSSVHVSPPSTSMLQEHLLFTHVNYM